MSLESCTSSRTPSSSGPVSGGVLGVARGNELEALTVLRTELEDIVHFLPDVTLNQLDAGLRRFISFCASYHGASLASFVPRHG